METNTARWLLALALFVVVVAGSQAHAEGKSWVISQKTLPAPADASDDIRAAIANTAQPDVAKHIRISPTTKEEWNSLIRAVNTGSAKRTKALIEHGAVTVKKAEIAGVTVRTVTPANIDPANENRLFVHLHGGAYVLNGGSVGLSEAIVIANHANIQVMSIDYRMPPAHPFPAALNDVISVWKNILGDWPAKSIALGGTSAGGGLTLASTLRFMELGLETPGALWVGTPWADLTKTGDSLFTNEGIDRMLVSYHGVLEGAAKLYANDHDLKTPLISPVYGEFKGFPPTYLVTGTRDLFLSDTVRIHRKLRVAGVVAELNVYEGISHGEYMVESPELQQAYGELGTFLLQHLQ